MGKKAAYLSYKTLCKLSGSNENCRNVVDREGDVPRDYLPLGEAFENELHVKRVLNLWRNSDYFRFYQIRSRKFQAVYIHSADAAFLVETWNRVQKESEKRSADPVAVKKVAIEDGSDPFVRSVRYKKFTQAELPIEVGIDEGAVKWMQEAIRLLWSQQAEVLKSLVSFRDEVAFGMRPKRV